MISATCYINSYAHVREWLRKGSKRTTATTNLQSNENARRAGGRARSLCHRDCRLPSEREKEREGMAAATGPNSLRGAAEGGAAVY